MPDICIPFLILLPAVIVLIWRMQRVAERGDG